MSSSVLVPDDFLAASDDERPQADLEHRANDETESEARIRERREKEDQRLRAALADPKKARAAYRDIADGCTQGTNAPTHAQFRVLSYFLRKADPDLSNVFPSQKTAAKDLGISRATYNAHLVALKKKGWVRTHEFQHEGRQTSSGVQFCIPNDALPLGESWVGPKRFDRDYGVPKKKRVIARKSPLPVVQSMNNGTSDS